MQLMAMKTNLVSKEVFVQKVTKDFAKISSDKAKNGLKKHFTLPVNNVLWLSPNYIEVNDK